MNKKTTINELIGKYLNGYKIVRIEKDPFIKGQINLWTDEEIIETFGDRKIVKFFVREDGNTCKIYRKLIDKEVYELKNKIKELECLVKSIKLGVTLNQEQEDLLDKILFWSDSNE